MSVVNCRVKFIRPKYHDLREWMSDPNNVYVGRKGIVFIDGKRFPPHSSNFHNPFKGERLEVINKFREYIVRRLDNEPYLVEELLSMRDKNLGCWCAPEPCHADVLLELIEIYSNK